MRIRIESTQAADYSVTLSACVVVGLFRSVQQQLRSCTKRAEGFLWGRLSGLTCTSLLFLCGFFRPWLLSGRFCRSCLLCWGFCGPRSLRRWFCTRWSCLGWHLFYKPCLLWRWLPRSRLRWLFHRSCLLSRWLFRSRLLRRLFWGPCLLGRWLCRTSLPCRLLRWLLCRSWLL